MLLPPLLTLLLFVLIYRSLQKAHCRRQKPVVVAVEVAATAAAASPRGCTPIVCVCHSWSPEQQQQLLELLTRQESPSEPPSEPQWPSPPRVPFPLPNRPRPLSASDSTTNTNTSSVSDDSNEHTHFPHSNLLLAGMDISTLVSNNSSCL